MPKIFFHTILIFSVTLEAQVSIINRSLTDSSLKIVYAGIENIIEFQKFEIGNGKRIGISNAKIIPLNKNKIKIIPEYGFKECIVTAEDLHNNSVEYIQVFKIDSLIGDIVIRLAGVSDSIASIQQILLNPFLISEIPGSYYKSPVYITSFIITFIGVMFDSLRTVANEHLLTQQQISIIKQFRRSDKIFFEAIYYFWPDGRRRKYLPFVITIK